MSDYKWAELVERLISSFYVASTLTVRKLLLKAAQDLDRQSARKREQAGRLLAIALNFPLPSFALTQGRDFLSVPTEL